MNVVSTLAVGVCCACAVAARADISDDFESYSIGSFPFHWQDVGFRDLAHGGSSAVPSVTVQSTIGPFGTPTQVARTIDSDQGNGLFIELAHSPIYTMSGDFRVEQYQEGATATVSSWAVQIGFVDTTSPDTFATIPQVGPYACAQTGGWRLFAIYQDPSLSGVDMDLGVSATPGVWYHLDVSLVVATGVFHTRILDALSGTVLADRDDVLPDWRPEFGAYNGEAIFDGEEFSAVGNNIASFDNINVVPAPATLVLLGLMPIARRRRR
ncbi:MAG: hypothetical protein IT436_15145 [Phycisphaerales bacterium]|nr:hypothetical protein [Phycisphaerales bacterium]